MDQFHAADTPVVSTCRALSAYDGRDMDINGLVVSTWLADLGVWPLVIVLVPNLLFRKYGQSAGKKRMSSLFQAIAVFVITTVAAFMVEKQLSDKYLYLATALVAVVLYLFREKVFPYKLKCVECDASLDFKTIYFMDDNLCIACHSKKVAAQEAAEQESAGELPADAEDESSEETVEADTADEPGDVEEKTGEDITE